VERRELGRGTTERACLFLGWESSFAVDAREFAGSEVAGGFAYFVGRNPRWTTTERKEVYGVCRYSFEDGTVTVMDELPAMFDKKSMWYKPRPRISPVPSSREPALHTTDQAAGAIHRARGWQPRRRRSAPTPVHLLSQAFPKTGEGKVAAAKPDEGRGGGGGGRWAEQPPARSPPAGVMAGDGRAYDSGLLGWG